MIKENKEIKLKKYIKSQPNFQHCLKKIEAQSKNDFLVKKRVIPQ